MSLTRFISVPENRSALLAVRSLAECLRSGERRAPNPLFLHGAPGCGKTWLVTSLVEELRGDLQNIALLPADELEAMLLPGAADPLQAIREADLLVVEDLHRLGSRAKGSRAVLFERLVQLVDHLRDRRQQMVFTARIGPGQLAQFPSGLVTRLAAGLVVGIKPYQFSSRLQLLGEKAQRRRLGLSTEVLAWIAHHVQGSLRQLDGALAQVETLGRELKQLPDVRLVADHLNCHAGSGPPTVEGIADRVSKHFGVKRQHVQSKQRYRELLLPRQISMYLARQLTGLSLAEIGSFFGDRDHTTVLHACRKVEHAMSSDPAIGSVISDLHSELA